MVKTGDIIERNGDEYMIEVGSGGKIIEHKMEKVIRKKTTINSEEELSENIEKAMKKVDVNLSVLIGIDKDLHEDYLVRREAALKANMQINKLNALTILNNEMITTIRELREDLQKRNRDLEIEEQKNKELEELKKLEDLVYNECSKKLKAIDVMIQGGLVIKGYNSEEFKTSFFNDFNENKDSKRTIENKNLTYRKLLLKIRTAYTKIKNHEKQVKKPETVNQKEVTNKQVKEPVNKVVKKEVTNVNKITKEVIDKKVLVDKAVKKSYDPKAKGSIKQRLGLAIDPKKRVAILPHLTFNASKTEASATVRVKKHHINKPMQLVLKDFVKGSLSVDSVGFLEYGWLSFSNHYSIFPLTFDLVDFTDGTTYRAVSLLDPMFKVHTKGDYQCFGLYFIEGLGIFAANLTKESHVRLDYVKGKPGKTEDYLYSTSALVGKSPQVKFFANSFAFNHGLDFKDLMREGDLKPEVDPLED